MTRILGLAVGIFILLTFLGGNALGGARGGKMRWSSNSDLSSGRPALKIPAATAASPGLLELKIVFKAGEVAEFALIGDGHTDLDLYVFDATGKEVAKDVDPPEGKGGGSDICLCRWTPESEQLYTIKIINYGRVYNVAQAACN